MQGARWLLPRAGYVVYALFGFGQLMINWLINTRAGCWSDQLPRAQSRT